MKTFRAWSVLLVALTVGIQFPSFGQQPRPAQPSTWQVYFSPNGNATSAILRCIQQARSSILVQAYTFTSEPIAEALIRAQSRGVRVQVLLDGSQSTQKYSVAGFLATSRVSVLIDREHAIAHNKVVIIDSITVITGSFNFTKAAEARNAENLVVIHDRSFARRFAANWLVHQQHSQLYSPR